MKTCFNLFAVLTALLISSGCANMLPSGNTTVKSPWQDYQSAQRDYEKIIPGVTTVEELHKMGFDPYDIPNIQILNSTDVINTYMPNPAIKLENLDPGIQKCIASKDRCMAYKIQSSLLDSKRIGSFWLDLFGFKRNTIATGWEFHGLITIVDGVVTHRDPAGGRPAISTDDLQKKPLGPLQDIGGIIQSTTPVLVR